MDTALGGSLQSATNLSVVANDSAIPVVTTRGVEDIFVTDKTVDGDVFLQFVEQCLVPVLQPFNGSNLAQL